MAVVDSLSTVEFLPPARLGSSITTYDPRYRFRLEQSITHIEASAKGESLSWDMCCDVFIGINPAAH